MEEGNAAEAASPGSFCRADKARNVFHGEYRFCGSFFDSELSCRERTVDAQYGLEQER